MKDMQRSLKVNFTKFKALLWFFLMPLAGIWEMLRYKVDDKSTEAVGAVQIVLYKIRADTGQTQKWSLVCGTLFLWILLMITMFGHSSSKIDTIIHSMEVSLAVLYYVWAAICFALHVATEVKSVPYDVPYKLASKQAQLSSVQVTLTRIADGQRIQVSGIGFLLLVCQLYTGDEEEEEEEEEAGDGEDEQLFNVSRSTLDLVWTQRPLTYSLPWVQPEVSRSAAVYEFKMWREIANRDDWNDNNKAMGLGMQTRIDLGCPTKYGEQLILVLAAVNGSLGCILRILASDMDTYEIVFGPIPGAGFVTIACVTVIFICSWFVYRTLFCTAFQWYTALTYMQQIATVLSITGATKDHLPCYIDLRHEGNLEGWYLAREYFCCLNDTKVFGIKDQIIVFSALLISAIISANAIANYFGDEEVDWSSPAPLMSLLNMQIIGGLLFLSLVALERMNNETTKLLEKLDLVAIEVSRVSSVQQSAADRQEQEELEEKLVLLQSDKDSDELRARMVKRDLANQRATLDSNFLSVIDSIKDVKDGVSTLDDLVVNVKTISQKLMSRMEISAEYQYLQNIITELRDQTDNKKILGIVIDRIMLSRIFGGVVGIMYIILKEFADQMIAQARNFTPMGAMLSQAGFSDGEDEGAGAVGAGYCEDMADHEVAVLQALNFSVSCVQEFCLPSCNASETGP